MSKNMLGLLPLSEVRGPLNDLNEKLAGPNGRRWLSDLKRLLRKQVITFLVGDGRSKEQVLADGLYDWISNRAAPFIASSNFRWASTREEVDIELVEFGYEPTSEEVLAEFTNRGLEEPTEEDALRFGEKYPDEQLKTPIVFLHQANLWFDSGKLRGVLVLGRDGIKRDVTCFWFDHWPRNFQFAARRPRRH